VDKKEVSMTELFFDLIFVYILSTINHTVEGISHNLMSPEGLGKSFMLFLVFYSIWIYRTLLVNRLFNKKWYQYLFVFVDMFLIIILSKAINEDFQHTFKPFVLTSALIYVSIIIQYFINYKLSGSKVDIRLVKVYTTGLSLTVIIALIATLLPSQINFWVYFLGIFIVAVYPLLFYKVSEENEIFFNHLTERLSLLIILLFGEGLVLLIQNIELSHVNMTDTLYFVFIVILFVVYTLHYKSTDKNTQSKTGFMTMYLHLFLIYSLDIIFLLMNKMLAEHHLNSGEVFGFVIFIILYFVIVYVNVTAHKPKTTS
jgi:low temperature requirement protein LtrA